MRIPKSTPKTDIPNSINQLSTKGKKYPSTKDSHVNMIGTEAYILERSTDKQSVPRNNTDKVEISHEGNELQHAALERAAEEATPKPETQLSFTASRIGNSNKFAIYFNSSAMVNRAVEQGFIELEGSRIELSEDVKKQLIVTSKKIQAERTRISMQNFFMHEAAASRQQSDAMKKASDKMSRVMTTASRIMHGRKVSPEDEKELMEFNKDLYAMAKNAAALEKHRHRKHDKKDDEISAANDKARARESEPKDYSVKELEMPTTETKMTISLEGESPQVVSVGEGAAE